MIGILKRSGIGTALAPSDEKSLEALRVSCSQSNERLVGELRECEHGAELLRLTLDDSKLGRMSPPRPVEVVLKSSLAAGS